MVTTQADPAAFPPLTPKDREMLAWYLGSRVDPKFLTREDLEPAYLESWAKSPYIARQISAFHYINSIASESINTANYIDAQLAVGQDLRAATTSTERLRAINAYIRLSSHRHSRATSCTGSPRPHERQVEATSATPSTHAPNTPRDRINSLPALPPLPPLPRSTDSQHRAQPPAAPTPAPAPVASAASNNPAVFPSSLPISSSPSLSSSPSSSIPDPRPSTSGVSHSPAPRPTETEISNLKFSGAAPIPQAPRAPHPTTSPQPRTTPPALKLVARDIIAKAGAAPSSAWP